MELRVEDFVKDAQYRNFYVLLNESHIMIGGATGSGKSVMTNNFLHCITSHDPEQRSLVLIDLKRVELSRWSHYPHVLKSITEPEEVIPLLKTLNVLMDNRYKKMQSECLTQSDAPYIYIVIDELAEVLRVRGAKDLIDRLLRLGRAANLHLIMATQNVSRGRGGVPAEIWQNVTCTIGLRCRSGIESRQIIGVNGCEDLPRYGYCIVQNAEGITKMPVPVIGVG